MDAMGPIYHQSRPASVFSYIFAATFSLFQLQLLMLETQSCGLDIATNWYIYIYQESKNLAELFSQTLRGMLAGSFHQDDMKHHIFFGLGDLKLNLHVPRFTVILGGVKGASPTSFSYGVMVCVCVCFFCGRVRTKIHWICFWANYLIFSHNLKRSPHLMSELDHCVFTKDSTFTGG